MVEETARHAGHVEILRELIDGMVADQRGASSRPATPPFATGAASAELTDACRRTAERPPGTPDAHRTRGKPRQAGAGRAPLLGRADLPDVERARSAAAANDGRRERTPAPGSGH